MALALVLPILVGLFQWGKVIVLVAIVVALIVVSSHATTTHGAHLLHHGFHIHAAGSTHAGHTAHAATAHAAHLLHQGFHVHAAGCTSPAHAGHATHALASLHVAHVESLFLLVFIDVSVPVDLDLVLF